jgi:hypothetical protein
LTNINENFAQITARLTECLRSDTPFTYRNSTYNLRDRQARIDVIDRITREQTVDPALLDRLADAILYEDLTGRFKDNDAEYPFLSDTQLARRRDGAHVRGSGGLRGEMSLTAADKLGADGRDYREPVRRWRTPEENVWLDRNVKSRNVNRASQYRRDTMPSRVKPYNLREPGGELTEPFVMCRGLGKRWADGNISATPT